MNNIDSLVSTSIAKAISLGQLGKHEASIGELKNTIRKTPNLSQAGRERLEKVVKLLTLSHQRLPQARNVEEGGGASKDRSKTGIDWPKISIVTPTYNQGNYIEDTILSIINQGYPNLEYIIMDGGSTDATHEVINKYLTSISRYVSEKDKGQSNAINKGMALATGEILYWLNSDDIMEPDTLLYVGLRYLDEGFDLLTGCCTPFDQDTGRLMNRHIATCPFGMRTEDITDIERTWLKGMYFHQPEVFFSRRLWEAAGGYVDEDLYYSMDYDLWVRMAVASGHNAMVLKAGKSFCLYRCHSNQKTSTTEVYLPELLSHSAKLRNKYTGRSLRQQSRIEIESRQRLSIVTISDFGFNGGAGIAHKRICQVLQAAGHDVLQLSGFQTWQSETLDVSVSGFVEALEILRPDMVVLGNLHNLRNGLEIAEACVKRYSTIAIAHDFWWITGRCAYTHSCQYYHSHCDVVCPTHNEYPRLSPGEIRQTHQRKKNLFSNPYFYLLANSRDTQNSYQEAIDSWGIRANIIGRLSLPIVPEGLDILTTPTRDRHKGIDNQQDQSIRIVFGCTDHSDFRKGTDIGIRVLQTVLKTDERIHVEVYGRNGGLVIDSLHKYSDRITVHGYISNKAQYDELLADSDIFLGLSREETLGQTFVEAAFAGLVTVGPMNTGYSDIVNACHFSYGFRSITLEEILSTLTEACDAVRQHDRFTLRAIQRSQTQASFSGMSCLSSLYDYLYRTGLAKKVRFLSPTKIYDLNYNRSEISELTLCASSPTLQDSHNYEGNIESFAKSTIPVSEWTLGPRLCLEEADNVPVAWLKAHSTFFITLPYAPSCKQIALNCHWIPDVMRQTPCTLTICGTGSWEALIPEIGNEVIFLEGTRFGPVQLNNVLLCSLQFTHTTDLEDGRQGLTVVAKGLDLAII